MVRYAKTVCLNQLWRPQQQDGAFGPIFYSDFKTNQPTTNPKLLCRGQKKEKLLVRSAFNLPTITASLPSPLILLLGRKLPVSGLF